MPQNSKREVAVNFENVNSHGTVDENPRKQEYDRRKSLGHVTREALPRLDHFRLSQRGLKRPSLGELHGDPQHQNDDEAVMDAESKHHGHFKLGWIQGVLIPVLLNIYGVMLFLRMGWIVAQSGIIETIIIIAISALICVITTLSLSAICTNGEVKGGGIYYIISRSLGPEFGASLGIVFAFANAIAASMNTIGFCDSLNELLSSNGIKIIDNGINDTRIVGTIAIFVMIIICAVGMEWEVKAQNVLLLIILGAIIDFIVGSVLGPSNIEEAAKGYHGFNIEIFKENLYPDYRFSEGLQQTTFTVFAIFFPSVTGIQAGANICGDLKDPAKAIPKGTLLALLLSMVTYMIFVIFVGGASLRDASGLVSEVTNTTNLNNFACISNHTCEYGLHNSYAVMQLMAYWSWLIYAGCFAATLSTALTNLLSVPRLVQALGIDKIFPGVFFFSKGYGKDQEPYRGYVLTLIIAVTFVLIADLNLIAPLITNFYLVAYALINFCTFHAAFVEPLGWRPTFKFYSKWLSLITSVLCIAIMFALSWKASLITFGITAGLYLIVLYGKPEANWGSSTQEQNYRKMMSSAYRYQQTGEHIKNYHPQILVLAGNPITRPPLIDLGCLLTKNTSLLMVGDVYEDKLSHRIRTKMVSETYRYFAEKKIKAFYNLIDDVNMETGIKLMIQSSGFGALSPNIVLMGYKSDWSTSNYQSLKSYFTILHNAFQYRVSMAILRMPNGLDYSFVLPAADGHHNVSFEYSNTPSVTNLTHLNTTVNSLSPPAPKLMHVNSNLDVAGMVNTSPDGDVTRTPSPMPSVPKFFMQRLPENLPTEVEQSMSFFQRKQPKGTIDVWWLYDDGGMTILLPYIISTRPAWSSCKIRIFALATGKREPKEEENDMANLLGKLRINYSSLIMIHGVTEPPKDETIHFHVRLLDGFFEGQNDECFVSDEEREKSKEKTNLHLRLRELLKHHSRNASLIVMSLPMPRQNEVSAPLYMSWLEVLTRSMPPFLLVRGNQTSVLTFNS